MYRHWIHRTLLTLVIGLTWLPSLATAERNRIPGTKGAMPPSDQLIPMVRKSAPAQPVPPNPENIARNPSQLVEFLKENPDRMKVDTMNPALVLTISELLLDGQAWFISEKLLHEAVQKWNDRTDLRRAHARVLIQLGRPDTASKVLGDVSADTNPEAHFLQGLALARSTPKTEAKTRQAIKSFQQVLTLRADYMDVSGWRARDIQRQIDRMLGVNRGQSPHP